MTPHPESAQDGQASVELIAVVPLILLAGAVAWQLALAGHSAWLAAHAARSAARADAVGEAPAEAARSALPRSLEDELEVERLPGGGVRVAVKVPLLTPRWNAPVRVGATASLGRRP